MKKLLRVFLPLVLVFAMLGSVTAGAVTFSDLNGHWAKDYMMDLYDRGYMKGDDNGLMRPEGNITGAEALVLLSRVFKTNSASLDMAKEDYSDYAAKVVPVAQSWLNDENAVVICLAGGVIGKSELEAMINAGALTKAIQKEYLAVLFVRAMQLTSRAQNMTTTNLTYADAASISAAYRPYVQVFSDCGIVQGDTDNNFAPKSSVTRAVAATMLSRTLKYLESYNGLPTLSQYENTGKLTGVLSSATSGTLVVNDFEGISYAFDLAADGTVTVNGAAKTLSAAYVGGYATVYYDTKTMSAKSVAIDTGATWVYGKLYSMTTTTSRLRLVVQDLTTEDTTTYTVDKNAACTYEENKVAYEALKKGYIVTVKLENNIVTEIHAYSGSYTLSGTITGLTYGSQTLVTVENTAGMTYQLSLDITKPPVIKRGTVSYNNGISKLKSGDVVEVTVESGVVKEIYSEANEAAVTGTVTSITQTTSGYSITVQTTGSGTTSYSVSPTVTVTKNNADAAITDLHVGDTVSIVAYGGEITDITISATTASSGSVTGTVQFVDTSARQLILLCNGTLVYVNVPSSATVVSSTEGTIYLAKIAVGTYVTAYGTAVSSTEYNATTVVAIQ